MIVLVGSKNKGAGMNILKRSHDYFVGVDLPTASVQEVAFSFKFLTKNEENSQNSFKSISFFFFCLK